MDILPDAVVGGIHTHGLAMAGKVHTQDLQTAWQVNITEATVVCLCDGYIKSAHAS